MANESMARSYAQAIFENAVESRLAPLRAIQAAIEKERLAEKLDDAKLAFPKKEELLKKVVPAASAGEIRNLVALLASKNQIHLLPDVIEEFDRYTQRTPQPAAGHVTSAVELKADEKKSLESKLQKQFGTGVEFDYVVDSALLGGIVVRVGDKVIDGSLAGRLSALREKLAT